jgi:hypothetical protein
MHHGLPVFGFESRPADWYLYLDGEDDRAEFERRACRIAKGLGVTLDDDLTYVEVPFKLNTVRAQRQLEALLDQLSVRGKGVVVYDSAQALFGGNQASGEVGDGVYWQIMCWAKRYNHTPVIIDHVAKGSESKGGKVTEFGSVHKGARVGSSLYLRQVEAPDACTTVVDLYNPKSNTVVVDMGANAPPLVRFKIHFDDSPRGAITFERIGIGVDRIEALPAEEVTVPEASALWQLSEQQTSRLLNDYCRRGLVERRRGERKGRGQPPFLYQRKAAE